MLEINSYNLTEMVTIISSLLLVSMFTGAIIGFVIKKFLHIMKG